MAKIAVSACLAGEACRYDGKSAPDPKMAVLDRRGGTLRVCPEVLGGLPTPRTPAEIIGGDGFDVLAGKARVISQNGEDVTAAFIAGAEKTLALLERHGIRQIVLKSRSPSCGVTQIYDGTFTGATKDGAGVAAAWLKKHGIAVSER